MHRLILLPVLCLGATSVAATPTPNIGDAFITLRTPVNAIQVRHEIPPPRKHHKNKKGPTELPEELRGIIEFAETEALDAHSIDVLTIWYEDELLSPEEQKRLRDQRSLNATLDWEADECLKFIPNCEPSYKTGHRQILFRNWREEERKKFEKIYDKRQALVAQGRNVAELLRAKMEEGESHLRKNPQRRSQDPPKGDPFIVGTQNDHCVDKYTTHALYSWFIERNKDPIDPGHPMRPMPNLQNVPCLDKSMVNELLQWYETSKDKLTPRDLEGGATNSTLQAPQTRIIAVPYMIRQLSISLLTIWHTAQTSQQKPSIPSGATISTRQEPQGLTPYEIEILDEYLIDLATDNTTKAAAKEHYEYLLEVDRRVDICLHRPAGWGGDPYTPDGYYEKFFRCIRVLYGFGGLGQEDWWVIEARKREEEKYLQHLNRVEEGKRQAAKITAVMDDEDWTYNGNMDDRLREVLVKGDVEKLRAFLTLDGRKYEKDMAQRMREIAEKIAAANGHILPAGPSSLYPKNSTAMYSSNNADNWKPSAADLAPPPDVNVEQMETHSHP